MKCQTVCTACNFCTENCPVKEVGGKLAGLNSSKSSGPDGIPATLFKCASYKIENSLTGVFRLSLQAGKVLFIVTTY